MSPADRAATSARFPGIDPHFAGRLGAIVTITTKVVRSCSTRRPFASRRSSSPIWSDIDEGDYTQEGNPDLRPEEISTTDFQVYYGNDRVTAAVTLFDSRQSNVIAETDVIATDPELRPVPTRGIEFEGRDAAVEEHGADLRNHVSEAAERQEHLTTSRFPSPGSWEIRDLISDGFRPDGGPARFLLRHPEGEQHMSTRMIPPTAPST